MLKTTALLLLFISSCLAKSYGQDILFALPRLGVNSTTNINGYYYSVWQERFYAKSFTAFRGVYKSNGMFPKKALTTEVYISYDTILSLDDFKVDSFTQDDDNALDCSSGCNDRQSGIGFLLEFKCDNKLRFGNYFLLIKLDATNILAETNENNNVGYYKFLYENFDCGAINLSVESRSTYEPGDYIDPWTLRIEARNTSSEDYLLRLNSYDVSLLLSTDLIVDTSDIILSSRNVMQKRTFPMEPRNISDYFSDTIKAYNKYNDNTYFIDNTSRISIPNNIPSGTYYLLLQTNPFYQPSFIRYTSPPIQIGTSATSIDKAESHVNSSVINQTYDLTGKEIDEKNRAGKLLIVVDGKGSRRLMKFD